MRTVLSLFKKQKIFQRVYHDIFWHFQIIKHTIFENVTDKFKDWIFWIWQIFSLLLLNFLNVKLRGNNFLIMLKIIHPCQVHIKEKIFMTFKGVCLVKLTKEEDGFWWKRKQYCRLKKIWIISGECRAWHSINFWKEKRMKKKKC